MSEDHSQVGGGGDGGEEAVYDAVEEDYDSVRPPGVRFIATPEGQQYLRRFGVQGHRVNFSIIEPREGVNPVLWLEAAIRDIHNYVSARVPDQTLIGISICNDRFARGPGGLSFRPVANFNYADLWNLISSISQSNEILGIGEALVLQVCYVEMPVGAGGIKLNDVKKRSIVVINNNDNLCLPRALAVGLVYVARKAQDCAETRAEWNVIRDGRRKLQKERAEKLVADAGVNIPRAGCGFEELISFQNFFLASRIALVVFEKRTFGSGEPALFDGRSTLSELNIQLSGTIYLMFDERAQHFNLITNLFAAAGSHFFLFLLQ